MSFFPFFLISSISLSERAPLDHVCVLVCASMSMLCVLTQYFNPVVTLQAPAHTTSVTVSTMSPQFSPN